MILVVDSDPKNLQILRESLESYDFRVTAVDNGIDAWGIVQSQKPDMIICEVDIPGINGFELQERLQKNPATAGVPIVFLTNRRNLEDRIRSLRSGVKDYMIKPLHVKEVIARIQMIVRRLDRIKSDAIVSETTETGKLEDKSVEDLIEAYGVQRKSGVLTLYDDHGRSGEIYFVDGMVVNARLGNFRAEKAVYQMLPWRRGQYTMAFKEVKVDEEIGVSNLGLLLQGFKRIQDREKLLEQLPRLQTVLVKTPIFEQVLTKKTISSDAKKFISLFDGQRTISDVMAESIYDDIKTLEKTVQLYGQGFVEARQAHRTSHTSTDARTESQAETIESVQPEPQSEREDVKPSPRLPSFDLETDWADEISSELDMEDDAFDVRALRHEEADERERSPDRMADESNQTHLPEHEAEEEVNLFEEPSEIEGNQPFEETLAEGPVFEDAAFQDVTPSGERAPASEDESAEDAFDEVTEEKTLEEPLFHDRAFPGVREPTERPLAAEQTEDDLEGSADEETPTERLGFEEAAFPEVRMPADDAEAPEEAADEVDDDGTIVEGPAFAAAFPGIKALTAEIIEKPAEDAAADKERLVEGPDFATVFPEVSEPAEEALDQGAEYVEESTPQEESLPEFSELQAPSSPEMPQPAEATGEDDAVAQETGSGEALAKKPSFGGCFDSLFNGNTSASGHLAVIGPDENRRKEIISILTAGSFSVKSVGKERTRSAEMGKVVTPKQNVVEIVGLSSDRILVSMLDKMSSPMLGYVVLIDGGQSINMGYWGYLLNSLKKKFPVPRTIVVRRPAQGDPTSLESLRSSLRISPDEQLVELRTPEADSIQRLLEKLQAAKAQHGLAGRGRATTSNQEA